MADVYWSGAMSAELTGVTVLFSSWGLWIEAEDHTWTLHPWHRIGKVTGLGQPVLVGSEEPSNEERVDLRVTLDEAERRLDAIGDVASGEVGTGVTAEEHLADAELRLNRIDDLVTEEDT